MFTGLITEVGEITRLDPHGGLLRITVKAPRTARGLKLGGSVAVSGVCLTATQVRKGKSFAADLAKETIARSSLSQLCPGSRVNLELPLRAGERLGGHIVQGHVDGVATLLELAPTLFASSARSRTANAADHKSDRWLRLRLPGGLERYVAEKGSIAVEGISLTVAKIEQRDVTIAIIPHSYSGTNLSGLERGDPLNIEVDVLAKYAEKRAGPSSNITLEHLIEEGF